MNLLEVLLKEEESLSTMIALLRNSLKNAPAGSLRISRSGQNVQYYYRPCKAYPRVSEQIHPGQNSDGQQTQDSHPKVSEQIHPGQNNDGQQTQDSHPKVSEQKQPGQNVSEAEAFYLKYAVDNEKFERGVYMRKSDNKLAYALAQRDYDTALLKVLENRLNYVQKLIELYKKREVEHVYEILNPYRKEIVHPRVLTDNEYAEHWLSVPYEGKLFAEGTPVMYTNKGERVRSKSEKIIADMLLQRGVFYRYEAPVILCGIGTVYPDFTILNVKRRTEIYWEHLGMMDQKDYCERALRKIEMYQRNGIILGRKLIITYETSQHPLETQMIERNIAEYCLA